MKNIFLFVGAILGTVFLVTGVVAIGRHDRSGWLYLVLALFCFVLAADPGGTSARFRRPATPGCLTNVAADKHFSDAASPQWL